MAGEPILERGLPPPLTHVAWSADIVAQSLEILPIFRDARGAAWLKPIHADSLRVGASPKRSPSETVLTSLARYGITPLVVHSTSWRTEADRMILTYVSVITPYKAMPEGPLDVIRIGRADLARGAAIAAPTVIGIEQVIEHSLRHLSWLVRDDPAIAEALADWTPLLDGYIPEPFRAFQA